jgi:hypothetical protein
MLFTPWAATAWDSPIYKLFSTKTFKCNVCQKEIDQKSNGNLNKLTIYSSATVVYMPLHAAATIEALPGLSAETLHSSVIA